MSSTRRSSTQRQFISIEAAMDAVVAEEVHPDVVRDQFGDEEGFEVLLKAAIAEREQSRDEPIEDDIPADLSV